MNTRLTDRELKTIQDIVMEQLGVKRDQLSPEAGLMEDLGADSLDLVEITIKTEEAFGISVPDEQTEKVRTMGGLCDLAGKLLHNPAKV